MRGTSRADTQQLLLLVNSNPSIGYGNESMKGNIAASFKTVDSKYSVSHSNGNGSGPIAGPRSGSGNSVSNVRVRHQSTSNFSDSVYQGDRDRDRDTDGAVSHRVSFDYGVGNVEDDIDSMPAESSAFSQANPSYYQVPSSARQRTKSSSPGLLTPRESVTLSKRSIPQSLGAFRERPLYSDHDVPLPGNCSEQYSEPDNVPESNRKRNGWSPKPRERGSIDPYMRERDRERDETSSSYTGSVASLSEGNRGTSKTSDRSRVSVSALLKLHLRSQPIDISNRRHSSATANTGTRGGRAEGTAPRYDRDEEYGSEEDRERDRDSNGIPSQFPSSRRFTTGGLQSSSSLASSPSLRADSSNRAGTTGGTSGGSGVSHEALLTALTMSMDKDASSLAMVV